MFYGMSMRVGAALVALFASSLYAQRPLVHESLDETQRVTLTGNVHPVARVGEDLGAAPDNQQTGSMFLVLSRSDLAQRSLDRLALEVSQPGTAQYRHWITPDEYGAKFGVSQSDVDQVVSWMEANGLTVESVPAARNVIRFSGTMSGLRSAFHTEIHRYAVGSRIELANNAEPSIPRALAPVVRGIAGLTNIRPRSNVVLAGSKSGPAPQFTSYGGQTWGAGSYDVNFEPVAGDAAVLYDAPNPAMNPKYTGTDWNGQGVTVGIAGDSNLSSKAIEDIARYRSLFLNEPLATAKADPQLPKMVVDGDDPGENGDELEALTDVEMVSAMAPKAMITLYTAASTDLQYGLFLAIERAITDNNVQILNISFSECEQSLGASDNQLIEELYQQAAAQGISITVSSGDSGSANCDGAGIGTVAQSGLAVNGLASTPWNIAVGGTDFDVLYTTNLATIEKYVSVPSSSNSIAGTSPYFTSALGYIPEEPWNDASASFTTYTNNTPYLYGGNASNLSDLGGGGGASAAAVCPGSVTTAGACSVHMTGYQKPAFQSSLTPSDGVRDLPDVSFFSGVPMSDDGDSQNFTAAWGLCADGTVNTSSGSTYSDCQTVPASGGTGCGGTCSPNYNTTTVTPVGGTSTSAPLMAGVLALVIESQGGNRLGQADPVLYNLAANHPADFHDVTAGNNAVACLAGSSNCGSNGFLAGFNAVTGYDLASGIGSLDVAAIIRDWSTVKLASSSVTVQAGTSATTLGSGPVTVAHGTTVYFDVVLGQPRGTGAVSLVYSANGATRSITSVPLSAGQASFSTAALPGGAYTVYAEYGGDSNYAGSQSAGISFNVTAESSALSATVNAYDAQAGNPTTTMTYGDSFYANVVPQGSSEGTSAATPATGTVTLSLDSVQVATLTLDAEGKVSYQLNSSSLTPNSGKAHLIKAQYGGDASYGPSSTSVSVVVQPAPPVQAAAGPAPGTVWTATQNNTGVGIGFNVWSLGVAPTGTVAFTMNGQSLGSPVAIWSQAGNAGEWVAGATIAVTPSQIGAGKTATFTATYSGDGNYAATGALTTSISVSGSGAGAGLSVSTSGPLTIAAATSGTETITVSPAGGLTGTVNLTCTGSGGSNAPSCSIPATVTITGSGSAKTTATISSASASAKGNGGLLFRGLGGGALVLSVVFFIPRRRNWSRALLLAVVSFVLAGSTACSAGSSSGTGGGGGDTTSTTYSYTVKATQGSASASTNFNVTVTSN